MKADSYRPKLRRLEHPWRLVVFIATMLATAGIGFYLGANVRSPNAALLEARNSDVPVYAAVEQRVVTGDVRIQGEVQGAQQQQIFVSPPAGTTRAIVTSTAATIGPLRNGEFIGTVSNRPIFVVRVEVPLFRSLRAGDSGRDVVSLQEALGVYQSGVVDYWTLEAVRALYRSADVDPPGGVVKTIIDTSEIRTFPAKLGPMAVSSLQPVGEALDSDRPFASLTYGKPYVTARASVSESREISAGKQVILSGADGKRARGRVATVGQFQPTPTPGGRPPGYDITITLDSGGTLASGDLASIQFGSAGQRQTAVPTIAIRSDAAGSYVYVHREGEADERVDVTILQTADGWSALKGTAVTPNERVLVSE